MKPDEAWLQEIEEARHGIFAIDLSMVWDERIERLLHLVRDLQAQVKHWQIARETALETAMNGYKKLEAEFHTARADLERYKKGWHDLHERVLMVIQSPRDEEKISKLAEFLSVMSVE